MFKNPSKIARIFFVIIAVVLLLAMCSTSGCARADSETVAGGGFLGSNISRWHDDEKAVTCWTYKDGYAGGISCIPDHMIKEPAF